MADNATLLLGNSIKFAVTFKNEDGDAYDPDQVSFELTVPEGSEATTSYPDGDPNITHDDVGLFHIWILPDVAGDYVGKFFGVDDDGLRKAAGCQGVTMTGDCSELST